MIGKRHWIGVGFFGFQDKAGDGNLKLTGGQLSGAFHLSLDKKSKNMLTLGVQWGKISRDIDENKLSPADKVLETLNGISNPMSQDELFMGGNNSLDKKNFQDINIGFLFKSKVSKTSDFNFGASTRHITTPGSDYYFKASQGNLKDKDVDLNMRLIAHAQLNTALNKQWTLTPEVYFSNISPAKQFQAHAWLGYWLKPEDNVKLNGGLGYRVGDSAQLLLGLDYKDFKVQLGYDFTMSDLAQANSRQGGFEIAAYYIGKIYKKPDVKPVILCPNL
jgi:type IX secretion system PorP/SprF family membrane protein